MRFLSLAWRNTLRNPRRTGLTIAAVSLGVTALVLAWALLDGGNAQMIENMTDSYTGHMQIHRRGYEDDPSLETVLTAAAVAPALMGSGHVIASTERLENRALISTEQNARGIILAGVDPEHEPGVTRLDRKINEGRYLRLEDTRAIILGQTLAKTLGVTVGGEVAVVTQARFGSVGASLYEVVGLYDTGNEMVDNMQAFITLDEARELFDVNDERTSVVVKLDQRDAVAGVQSTLGRELQDGYEVLSWRQLLPSVAQAVGFHEAVTVVILVFLFGIVTIGVANVVLMSVTERRREFGIMLSLGTTPWQIFRSIVYEGVYIGGIGLAIGVLLGGALVGYFAHYGIHFKDASGIIKAMQAETGVIYPTLRWGTVALMGVVMFFVAMMASLYPAIKTARLAPLDALHGLTAGQAPTNTQREYKSGRFLLLQLALRNIWRQPVRTRLTMAVITLSLGAFIFLSSIAIGYYSQTIENATGTITGDAQVLQAAFKSDMNANLAFAGNPLLDQLSHVPGVQAVSPRVQTQALIGIANRSEPVLLIGISPTLEPQVTFINKAVRQGRYLMEGDSRDIVIGVKLAELLRVGVGEKVVINAQDRNGNLNSEAFVIAGLFDTGSQGHGIDRLVGYITLPSAQHLLALDDDITNLSLRFTQRDDDHVLRVVQQINAHLGDPKLTAMSWQALLPEVVQMRALIKKSLLFVVTIVFVMVAIVVMNTILMSVLERTREFGIMLALGSSPSLVVRLVMLESAAIGLFATALGTMLGVVITLIHVTSGVNMAAHGLTAVPGVTNVIHPQLTVLGVLGPAVILPVVILLAALYPAVRASRLAPIKAMHQV